MRCFDAWGIWPFGGSGGLAPRPRWLRPTALRLLILLVGLILSFPLFATGIGPANKYAWAENAGWLNFNSIHNSASVQVYADHLEGYLWAENIGWIRLGSYSGGGTHSYGNTTSPADYGVNRNGSTLGGYAWSETAGWINFAPNNGGVSLDGTTGQFSGYAWSENVGWIHLRGAAQNTTIYGVDMLTGGAVGLTSSLNPSTVGQTVTFTATLVGTPTPTGTVNFSADSAAITGCTSKALSSGAATCATSALSIGNHAITAAYSGDSDYNSSTGNLTQTVNSGGGGGTGPIYSSIPITGGLISFGPVAVGASATQTLSVGNTGDALLVVSTMTVTGADAGDFTPPSPTSFTLASAAARTLTLACTPTVVGTRTATLTISHNAPGTPASYPLSCSASAPTQYRLSVAVLGSGTGVVTSSPAGINCGADCTEDYATGASVTLTATPASGSTFTGWGNGCSGTATICTVTMSAARTVTATFTGASASLPAVGVFREGQWFLDANGNSQWNECGVDHCDHFGQPGDLPVVGNWDGGVKSRIGVFRPDIGKWFLDRNANGQWDECVADGCYTFGQTGDLPVAGDWIGAGFAQIGVFRNGQWFLDANGNGQWDGCGSDLCQNFGQPGDLPVVGDWNGDGKTKIGVFRNGEWFLDANGNGQWDGCAIDRCVLKNSDQPSAGFGQPGDFPIVGDWTGDGVIKIGVFRNGSWFFDANGNGAWDGCGTDRCYLDSFGQKDDLPIVGRW